MKTSLSIILAAIILTGCGPAADEKASSATETTHSDWGNDPEADYLYATRELGPSYFNVVSDAEMLEMGYKFCGYVDEMGVEDTLRSLYINSEGNSETLAGVTMTGSAAVKFLCPEHEEELTDFVGGYGG